VSRTFKTWQEASTWTNEQRYRRDKKIVAFQGNLTIRKLFENYLTFAKNKGRAAGTLGKAHSSFKQYLEPFYGMRDIRDFPIEAHEAFLGKLREKKFDLKPASVNRIRSLLSVMFNVAIRKRHFNGALKENPFLFIEKMDETRPNIDYWNNSEVYKFLNHTVGTHYYPLWVFLLNTGLRIGETVALDVSQIDTLSDILVVDRTWCKFSRQIKHKTKNGIRKIGLNEAVKEVLYPILATKKSGLVFSREEDGGMMSQEYLSRNLTRRFFPEAEVKHIGLHGFRHTYARLYLENGGTLADLQHILGHSTPALTYSYYAHFDKDHIVKRANVISVKGNVIQGKFKKAQND
jgi:integrase